ncbi:MAG: BatA domain-containing protein [Vicinamibacterales bacterium]
MGPLSFLFPLFLAGAAAVAVPFVLHLLNKDEAPEVEFPAVRFIKSAPVERSRKHRPRDLILLAIRMSALVLLALAFARPYFTAATAAASPRADLVLVDVSYSMGGAAREGAWRDAAIQALDRAPADAPVGVIAFDDSARVVAPLGADRQVARKAIQALTAGYGGTNYRAALAAAAAELGGRTGQVTVITDSQARGWADGMGELPPGVEAVPVIVPPVTENLSLTSVARTPDGVRASVASGGARRRDTVVSVYVGDRVVQSRQVVVEAGQTADVSLAVALPDAGVGRVAIRDDGGLPGDDERFVVLEPAPPINVRVITSDASSLGRSAFYVERALAVTELPRPVRAETWPGTRVQAVTDDELSSSDVLIVLGTRGVDRRTRDRVREWVGKGGGLFIALGSAVDNGAFTLLLGEEAQLSFVEPDATAPETSLAPADVRHPIFRSFGAQRGLLGQPRFRRVVTLEPTDGVGVLARFTSGRPALVERRLDRGRVLVFASDLGAEWNDLPRRPSFVPFLSETVGYLAGGRRVIREVTMAEAPGGVERKPGLVAAPGDAAPLVLNVDPAEADVSAESGEAFGAHLVVGAPVVSRDASKEAARHEDEQGLWRYGLIVALFVLAGETVLGRMWG